MMEAMPRIWLIRAVSPSDRACPQNREQLEQIPPPPDVISIARDNHTANEGPARMQCKCFPLCVHRNETVQPPCFQNRLNVLYPNSYTHISVKDLYISRIGTSILLHAKYVDRSWEYINRSQTHECKNWDMRPRNSYSGNTSIGFSVECSSWTLTSHSSDYKYNKGRWQLSSLPVGLYSHQHRWFGALAKPPISTLLFSSLWASLRNLTGALMYLFSCTKRRNQNRIFDIPPPPYDAPPPHRTIVHRNMEGWVM